MISGWLQTMLTRHLAAKPPLLPDGARDRGRLDHLTALGYLRKPEGVQLRA
jgi:hypothetical protein